MSHLSKGIGGAEVETRPKTVPFLGGEEMKYLHCKRCGTTWTVVNCGEDVHLEIICEPCRQELNLGPSANPNLPSHW